MKKYISKILIELISLSIAVFAILVSIHAPIFKDFNIRKPFDVIWENTPSQPREKIQDLTYTRTIMQDVRNQYVFWIDVSQSVKPSIYEELKKKLKNLIFSLPTTGTKISIYTVGNQVKPIDPFHKKPVEIRTGGMHDLVNAIERKIVRDDKDGNTNFIIAFKDLTEGEENPFGIDFREVNQKGAKECFNFLVILSDMKDDPNDSLPFLGINIKGKNANRDALAKCIGKLQKADVSIHTVLAQQNAPDKVHTMEKRSLVPILMDQMEDRLLRFIEFGTEEPDFLFRYVQCKPIFIHYWGAGKESYGTTIRFSDASRFGRNSILKLASKKLDVADLEKMDPFSSPELFRHLKLQVWNDNLSAIKNRPSDNLLTILTPIELGQIQNNNTITIKPFEIIPNNSSMYHLLITNRDSADDKDKAKRYIHVIPVKFKEILSPSAAKIYKYLSVWFQILFGVTAVHIIFCVSSWIFKVYKNGKTLPIKVRSK